MLLAVLSPPPLRRNLPRPPGLCTNPLTTLITPTPHRLLGDDDAASLDAELAALEEELAKATVGMGPTVGLDPADALPLPPQHRPEVPRPACVPAPAVAM